MATHTHVLVTGGAGFIGSHLVDGLLADGGTRVTALDKLTYAGSRENLAEHEGDDRFRSTPAWSSRWWPRPIASCTLPPRPMSTARSADPPSS